jgi:hypothetical protein
MGERKEVAARVRAVSEPHRDETEPDRLTEVAMKH